MQTIRRLIVEASPLKHSMLYSNRRFQKPQVTFRKKTVYKERVKKGNQEFIFGQNPGIEGQLNALDLTEQEMRDPNVLEDMEQQFWNVDKIDNTINMERRINQDLQSIYQVTRKQFKEEKLPNMLLWDEKQQIRALHAQDPEKWTHMQLAFSFPATPSIIKKIIRAKWKFTSAEQIEKHDARVQRNWDALSKNELEVPNEDLKKHLLTFSQRRKIQLCNRKDIALQTTHPSGDSDRLKHILKDGGVFGNIYKSHKPTEQIKTEEESSIIEEKLQSSAEAGLKKLYQPPQNDTFIIPLSVQNVKHRTNKLHTLENMKDTVLKDVVKGKTLEADEMKFIQDKLRKESAESTYTRLQDPIGKESKEEFDRGIDENSSNNFDTAVKAALSVEEICTTDISEDFMTTVSEDDTIPKFIDVSEIKNIDKLEDKEIFASLRTAKIARNKMDDENVVKAVKEYISHSSESYPLEIAIPKDKWKKGALYRVSDRFYTDDGEFLYRVPGLSRE